MNDIEGCRCNNCMRTFDHDDELALLQDESGYYKGCPDCGTDAYLMDWPGAYDKEEEGC